MTVHEHSRDDNPFASSDKFLVRIPVFPPQKERNEIPYRVFLNWI